MFCPRCGQEQVSENTRFCSRCGFLLETVAEVLANGGILPQLLELGQSKKFLTRKNGIKSAVLWAVVWWVFIVPLMGIADAHGDLIAVAAVFGLIGTLLLMLISFFFLDNQPKAADQNSSRFKDRQSPQNLSGNRQNVLPPQQSYPVENYAAPAHNWKAPNTSELLRVPSVTEETTKLLKKDE